MPDSLAVTDKLFVQVLLNVIDIFSPQLSGSHSIYYVFFSTIVNFLVLSR